MPGVSAAQETAPGPVSIDSVHLRVENVFSEKAAREHWIYDAANSVRFQTRPWVVRRELLFDAGDTLDLSLIHI